MSDVLHFTLGGNGWLGVVPPYVGFAGLLFASMDSKRLLQTVFVF